MFIKKVWKKWIDKSFRRRNHQSFSLKTLTDRDGKSPSPCALEVIFWNWDRNPIVIEDAQGQKRREKTWMDHDSDEEDEDLKFYKSNPIQPISLIPSCSSSDFSFPHCKSLEWTPCQSLWTDGTWERSNTRVNQNICLNNR